MIIKTGIMRRFSTRYNAIHPQCSLEQLAYNIGFTYNKLQDLYPELTGQKVREIQKSIEDGTYTLSPLLLGALNGEQMHRISVKDYPDMCVNPTPEDGLVLTALGRMLNLFFLYEKIFMDKSFGMRTNVKSYYDNIRERRNVKRLYKLDLTRSIMTINRQTLFCKLAHLVDDFPIMSLVSDFLHLPVRNSSGRDYTAAMGLGIPTVGLLTCVLLNFALIEFDEEFQRVFPCSDYSRYVHEVFVSFPSTSTYSSQTLESFELEVLSLFDQLNLDGKILSIGPGDEPVPCFGGLVCVSQDGIIEVKEKKLEHYNE